MRGALASVRSPHSSGCWGPRWRPGQTTAHWCLVMTEPEPGAAWKLQVTVNAGCPPAPPYPPCCDSSLVRQGQGRPLPHPHPPPGSAASEACLCLATSAPTPLTTATRVHHGVLLPGSPCASPQGQGTHETAQTQPHSAENSRTQQAALYQVSQARPLSQKMSKSKEVHSGAQEPTGSLCVPSPT